MRYIRNHRNSFPAPQVQQEKCREPKNQPRPNPKRKKGKRKKRMQLFPRVKRVPDPTQKNDQCTGIIKECISMCVFVCLQSTSSRELARERSPSRAIYGIQSHEKQRPAFYVPNFLNKQIVPAILPHHITPVNLHWLAQSS